MIYNHTITLNFKRLPRHPSANLYKFLIPRKNVPIEPDQSVTAMAHEVRNPLTTITMAVHMLRSPDKVLEHKLYLDIIMKASGQINDLLNDLLATCHPLTMQLERCSVHELLDEALAMAEDRILLKNIVVRKDYTTLDCKILVNRQKVKIAFTNIIINAIDAMLLGNGQLILLTRSINGKCVVEIEDNGIGISKGNLQHIFTPYYTDKIDGMGLGLSTTMNFLTSNHATTEVESEEGKGTRFILSFEKEQQIGGCL